MNFIPEPCSLDNIMTTRAFHSASTQFDFVSTDNTDFDNSCIYGDECVFDKLYDNIENTENKRLHYGLTPIMFAVWNQNTVFFYHLLNNYNVNFNLTNNYGQTILHLVCMRKMIEYIEPLVIRGADIYTRDTYGYSSLDYLTNYPINTENIIRLYKKNREVLN